MELFRAKEWKYRENTDEADEMDEHRSGKCLYQSVFILFIRVHPFLGMQNKTERDHFRETRRKSYEEIRNLRPGAIKFLEP
jgi:hypothetical protein